MHEISVKKPVSYLLVFSMWLACAAVVPVQSLAQQTDSPSTATAKDSKKDKKKSDKTAPQIPDDKTASQNTTAQTTGGSQKPLSVKEDPAQIGKRNINGGTDKLFGWFGGSKEKEMAIGRQLALEVEQQAKMVDDPMITEYINRVGQNIVLHSDAKVPFTIKVIDSDEVNAFALPGGFFFVNKGLIIAADSEAELAGVMAHEIAHVAARHAMENQGKGAMIQYGMLATILLGIPIASQVAYNGGGILSALAGLKFSRGAEEEADMLGVQYLYASGYDPTGMATMFEKLASKNKKKPGTIQKLFSTHPPSAQRHDTSLALVARFPEKEEYIISTSEFQRVKSYLLKITNAKAGVTADIDETDNSRPTLKRRQPESTDPTTGDPDSGSSSSDGPPKLKKKTEPDPQPTPSPEE
jgi:hypothetical protein